MDTGSSTDGITQKTSEQTIYDFIRHPRNGKTSIYLIRHGQTEGNANHLFIGSTDIPLDTVGERQALILGKRFSSIDLDAIISSPLKRAKQTAARIAKTAGMPVEISAGFSEIDFGDVEGITIEAFESNYPARALLHKDSGSDGVAWPNGESRMGFNIRVRETFMDVLERYNNRTVAIVSHGGVIGSLLSHIQGGLANDWARYAVQNCSITHIEVSSTHTRIHLNNDYSHLDDVQIDMFGLNPVANRKK